MIRGIGIDLADIARMESAYKKFGERFAERILVKAEMESAPRNFIFFLAGRFAAKEAAVKALGTGFNGNISFHDLQILNDAAGAPVLYFQGHARKRFLSLGAKKSYISITHERTMAAAVVILEG